MKALSPALSRQLDRRLPEAARRLLVDYVMATRALRRAARSGHLERMQAPLMRRHALIEELIETPVANDQRPRVRRILIMAEESVKRAVGFLEREAEDVQRELGDVSGLRRRGRAFETASIADGDARWLDQSG